MGTDSPARPPVSPYLAGGEKEILLGKNGFTDASVIPKVIPQREKSIPFRHPGSQELRVLYHKEHLSFSEITFLKQNQLRIQESWRELWEGKGMMDFLSTSLSNRCLEDWDIVKVCQGYLVEKDKIKN